MAIMRLVESLGSHVVCCDERYTNFDTNSTKNCWRRNATATKNDTTILWRTMCAVTMVGREIFMAVERRRYEINERRLIYARDKDGGSKVKRETFN